MNDLQVSDIKLSIIIPCHNQEKYIARTLDSVVKQNFLNWECVIIDDGSNDHSKNIIKDYVNKDKRVKYYYQVNKGVSSARNYGINLSSGEYLLFLDADDIISQFMCEKFIQLLEQKPNIDIVYGGYDTIDEFDNHSPLKTIPTQIKIKYLQHLVIKNIFTIHAAILKKSVAVDIGCFDEKIQYSEDWDFWLRAALYEKKFYSFNEIVCSYRHYTENASNNYYKMYLGAENVLLKNADLINNSSSLPYNTLHFSLNNLYLSSYAQAKKMGDMMSLQYFKPKVKSMTLNEMSQLLVNYRTLPALLNYAEVSESIFFHFIFYPISLTRTFVRKIVIKKYFNLKNE
ncbi:MAG: glycosyltransferase [gamma proteobacterium symbiont of Taylorina sp.]|nr:glycosyltransferase [gamma proteobacterium symbiont of Taylorina sp.]